MSGSTYVLIPGAGGDPRYWQWVVPFLTDAGNAAIAVDLPADDDAADLATYADCVCEAAADVRGPMILVAQSMGGFTAPLVAQRRRTDLIVLLNAMEYLQRIGLGRSDFDFVEDFFHDVPDDVKHVVRSSPEPRQSDTPFVEPWPLDNWPSVPTRFLQGADDRLFPLDFQRRVVRERLGIDVDVMPGGHLLAFSRARDLAGKFESYRREAGL